jgi:predicted unusual protein kinase regulating ubiquinone biosynthesis (AarF/ABC1/UbiB family)
MPKDWEKLAGEEGEEVTSSRLSRMLQLGRMGARVGASSLASKLKSKLTGGSAAEREEALREAYAKNARHMVDVLGKLKGASMKVGQLLSADPELMPDGFADELSALQRDAPPMTYMTVKRQIEEALDRPIETVFTRFDPEPIGSASIGQVHRARLDTGEEVAVKVQYPGVADSLESDLKSLRSMMTYGRAVVERERLDDWLAEIREILRREADYRLEAENLGRFHELLAEREGLRAPRPFPERSAETVLVMEFMEGEKLDDALQRMGEEERNEWLERWLLTFVWMFHELSEIHADPHPGNFLLQGDDLVMLDFGCVKSYDPSFTDGMLEILDCCWQDDHERAREVYLRLGFGVEGSLSIEDIDPDLLWEYHNIVLAPFLRDEPFAFEGWTPAMDGKMFMMRHPSFLKLVPPRDALLYFRMLSGIKGLLARFDARINVYRNAVDIARRRDVLTDEPLVR